MRSALWWKQCAWRDPSPVTQARVRFTLESSNERLRLLQVTLGYPIHPARSKAVSAKLCVVVRARWLMVALWSIFNEEIAASPSQRDVSL